MAVTKSPAPAPAIPWENPLTPTKKLRELYVAMVELRLLEEHLAARKKSRIHTDPGEEGCRVTTALSLLPGDLTSDGNSSIASAFLRGAKLPDLLQTPSQLPVIADTAARLHMALGAALARKKGSLVVVYIYSSDLTSSEWKPILRLLSAHVAPIILAVLPETKSHKPGRLSEIASACGVPGIPVDAADPVALYRVAQESMLRARAGGGPVLMECIPFQLPGQKTSPSDPILTMRQSLLHRKIATEAWMQSVSDRFTGRLESSL